MEYRKFPGVIASPEGSKKIRRGPSELKTSVEHKLSSGLDPSPPAVALRG